MRKYSILVIILKMNLSLLQIILIVSVVIIGYMIVDAWRQRKLRIFHALVFSCALFAILWFIIKPDDLTRVGQVVWVSRWADFLVYLSIIFLVASVFSLIQRSILHQQELTKLVTRDALREAKWWKPHTQDPSIISQYMFLIRAYNEATTIVEVLEEIIQEGRSTIVICNDGSSDDTLALLEQTQKRYVQQATIIILSHIINRGPGAANKTLFEFAQYHMTELGCSWAISYDADGQMDIKDMKQFVETTQTSQYDIVFGSRFVAGAKVSDIPRSRKIILKAWRLISYIFTGIWLSDVSTGYRAYNLKALQSLQLSSDRYSYQNDIIDSVKHAQLRFVEIPVHIKYTPYSLSKWQSNQSAFKILIHMIYSSLFER